MLKATGIKDRTGDPKKQQTDLGPERASQGSERWDILNLTSMSHMPLVQKAAWSPAPLRLALENSGGHNGRATAVGSKVTLASGPFSRPRGWLSSSQCPLGNLGQHPSVLQMHCPGARGRLLPSSVPQCPHPQSGPLWLYWGMVLVDSDL